MKKSIITLLFSSLLFACTQKYSDASYKVIPLPQQISLKKTERSFTMNSATRIFFKDLALKGIANQFSTTVKHNANLNLQVEQGDKKEGANVVIFELGLKHTLSIMDSILSSCSSVQFFARSSPPLQNLKSRSEISDITFIVRLLLKVPLQLFLLATSIYSRLSRQKFCSEQQHYNRI